MIANSQQIAIPWIEDKVIAFNRSSSICDSLRPYGFQAEIIPFTKPEKFIKYFKQQNEDLLVVFIDIDLNDKNYDGIKIYREIRKTTKRVKCMFISGHLTDLRWENLIEEIIEEDKFVGFIEKPIPQQRSKDFEKVVTRRIVDLIGPQNESSESIVLLAKGEMTKNNLDFNPFNYTHKEFLKLSENEIDLCFELAHQLNNDFIDKFFEENPKLDWMIVAKEPGNIIMKGERSNEPFESDLFDISKTINAPVFTYSRPIFIETIDTTWSKIDSYPSLRYKFKCLDNNEFEFKCDFDTGSVFTFLGYEFLVKEKIINTKTFQTWTDDQLWNEKIKYFNDFKECSIFGISKEVQITLKYLAVKDWAKSPLTKRKKTRMGLTGRNVLLDNKLQIILDGDRMETDIK